MQPDPKSIQPYFCPERPPFFMGGFCTSLKIPHQGIRAEFIQMLPQLPGTSSVELASLIELQAASSTIDVNEDKHDGEGQRGLVKTNYNKNDLEY
jgi:hypothetical protein